MNVFVIALLLFFSAAVASQNYEAPEDNVMLSMPRSELMDILDCIHESKTRQQCRWYSKCLSVLPKEIMMAYSKCRVAYTGFGWIPCDFPGPLWPTKRARDAGGQVFDCSNAILNRRETPEEEMGMTRFEICARELYAAGCMHHRRHHEHY